MVVPVGCKKGVIGLAALLSAAGLSCSVLVNPESLVVRCDEDAEQDPCAEIDMQCIAGVCQARECGAEVCNGLDDDCDDEVDEGQDVDGDGFTWCGTNLQRGRGVQQQYQDCQPRDASIHPPDALREGAPSDGGRVDGLDPCDGKDNDCDGDIDEGSECAATQDCTQESCAALGLSCDQEMGRCIAPRPEGSRCNTDAECEDGFCADPEALDLDMLGTRICGRACCTDSDCDQGSSCVHAQNGARVCLPSEFGARQDGEPGERCEQDAQCLSGVCVLGRCTASCTRNEDCSGEDICAINSAIAGLFGGSAWVCGPAVGRGEVGARCSVFDPTACLTGLCLTNRCAAPCATDVDCPQGLSCRYVAVEGLLTSGREGRLTACVASSAGSEEAPCCTNADCDGAICEPMRREGGWGMFCGRAVSGGPG